MPIAPEPMTMSDFGIAGGTIASKYGPDAVAVRLDAGARGRAPVAMMMLAL